MRGKKEYRPLQKETLLQFMSTPQARKAGVTVMEIMMYTGIGDPRARIRDLIDDGHKILKVWEVKKYPGKRTVRYRRYYLVD